MSLPRDDSGRGVPGSTRRQTGRPFDPNMAAGGPGANGVLPPPACLERGAVLIRPRQVLGMRPPR